MKTLNALFLAIALMLFLGACATNDPQADEPGGYRPSTHRH
jgi:hypothetical protein